MNSQPRDRLVLLDPAGAVDPSFNPGADGEVRSLLLQPDGKLLVGGTFTTLGGQPRQRIGRLSCDLAMAQSLTISLNGSILTWMREGPGPELGWVAFEQSTDGVTYSPLGQAARIPNGWQLTGLDLPDLIFIRARGFQTTASNNASGSIFEFIQLTTITDEIFALFLPLITR